MISLTFILTALFLLITWIQLILVQLISFIFQINFFFKTNNRKIKCCWTCLYINDSERVKKTKNKDDVKIILISWYILQYSAHKESGWIIMVSFREQHFWWTVSGSKSHLGGMTSIGLTSYLYIIIYISIIGYFFSNITNILV